jgi:hypothetical protein
MGKKKKMSRYENDMKRRNETRKRQKRERERAKHSYSTPWYKKTSVNYLTSTDSIGTAALYGVINGFIGLVIMVLFPIWFGYFIFGIVVMITSFLGAILTYKEKFQAGGVLMIIGGVLSIPIGIIGISGGMISFRRHEQLTKKGKSKHSKEAKS